jgi:hypothetical protein
MRSILTAILGLLLSTPLNRAAEVASIDGGVFTNTDLGFTFNPPNGLRDLTAALKEQERGQSKDGRTRFSALLWMASGPDDTAVDWVSLGIETYPRGRNKDTGDDVTASFITNHSAVPGVTTERLVVRFSGQDFAMSRVELKAATVTKYAVVYTTVRKEQFVTFIFAGNARGSVDKLAESMRSVKFHP